MSSRVKDLWNGRNCVTLLVVALMALGVFATGNIEAKEKADLVVGTYKARQVAQATAFMEKMKKIQTKARKSMQAAQKNKDGKKKMQSIIADVRKKQQKLQSDFMKKMKKAVPEAAKKAGVHVVAQRVEYTADNIKTKDITKELIKVLGGDPDAVKGKKKIMPKGKKKKVD